MLFKYDKKKLVYLLLILTEEDEYMSFGISGSETSSQMEGADVVIAYMDEVRGHVVDYNITAKAPVCKYNQSIIIQ